MVYIFLLFFSLFMAVSSLRSPRSYSMLNRFFEGGVIVDITSENLNYFPLSTMILLFESLTLHIFAFLLFQLMSSSTSNEIWLLCVFWVLIIFSISTLNCRKKIKLYGNT